MEFLENLSVLFLHPFRFQCQDYLTIFLKVDISQVFGKLLTLLPFIKDLAPKHAKPVFGPISLLPTLSKIYDSVIHDRLIKHCIENEIITEKQAAYLKGDSTVSQLLYIVHNIKHNWTNKKVTQGLFLDVSAAFHKVWHNGLLA